MLAGRTALVTGSVGGIGLAVAHGLAGAGARLVMCDIAEAVQPSPAGGYDVLPANRELAGAELELVDFEERESRLKDALAAVDARYDVVLIDCPPSLSLLTLNGFCAAHGVIDRAPVPAASTGRYLTFT